MAGHYQRSGLWHGLVRHLGLRFDWFAGMIPHIPAKEKAWQGVRLLCYAAAAAAAAQAWVQAATLGCGCVAGVAALRWKKWVD